jgi:hypothetical protein
MVVMGCVEAMPSPGRRHCGVGWCIAGVVALGASLCPFMPGKDSDRTCLFCVCDNKHPEHGLLFGESVACPPVFWCVRLLSE